MSRVTKGPKVTKAATRQDAFQQWLKQLQEDRRADRRERAESLREDVRLLAKELIEAWRKEMFAPPAPLPPALEAQLGTAHLPGPEEQAALEAERKKLMLQNARRQVFSEVYVRACAEAAAQRCRLAPLTQEELARIEESAKRAAAAFTEPVID